MLRFAIIDDEIDSRSNLRQLIADCCPSVQIVGEAEGVQSGYALLSDIQVDAIFLDIQMKDGTGFDLLAKFERPAFYVIFATGFSDFAIKAFEYNAIDYLLKPVEIDQLQRVIAKVDEMVQAEEVPDQHLKSLAKTVDENDFSQMVISTAEGTYFVSVSDIRFLRAYKNYTTFFMNDGSEITCAKTLGTFVRLLPDQDFVRVHQSYLVRFKLIRPFLQNKASVITLVDGEQIPLSRRRRDILIDKMKQR